MKIPDPTPAKIADLAAASGIALSDEEAKLLCSNIADSVASLQRLDSYRRLVPPPRGGGERASRKPTAAENALNAWSCRSDIRARDDGPLAGRSIAIKDSIAVAGLPMANGSSLLEGFVPDFDATVVRRVLEAGGTITGKATCDALCLAGSGHTPDTGPVRNPHDRDRLAGGSSGGCAALVASGAADMAIGGDNGGSIRMPAAWCGIYGLKPTWGLVPYTGACSIHPLIDHLGPMARGIDDLERLLAAIAGPDDADPRQLAGLRLEARTAPRAPLRVGILREGFGWPRRSDPALDALVEESARALERHGCEVRELSIPLHREAMGMLSGLQAEVGRALFELNGAGGPFAGYANEELIGALGRWRGRAAELPLTGRFMLLGFQYLRPYLDGRAYATSLNLVPVLRAAYDRALEASDVLVLPTLPVTARRVPEANASAAELLALAWQGVNTRVFNATGHPVLNVPCGMLDGLPVGMSMIGRRGDDLGVLHAARVFSERVYAPRLPVGD